MNQIERFKAMVEMRFFDEACLEGVPTMEIHGELHTGIGQEAISAGLLGHLKNSDALVSTHRNHYHALIKGVNPYRLMSEIFEKKTGKIKRDLNIYYSQWNIKVNRVYRNGNKYYIELLRF